MDFDLAQIPVPFRMQPGLARLQDAAAHLTPLAPGSALFEEKRRVREAGQSRHAVAGFDPAPALASIARQAAAQGLPAWGDAQRPLELAFEEDFAILHGATGTLPWLCVCTPSHWAPEDKLGLDFASVHAPVADNRMLQAASRQLVDLVTRGGRWERQVWSISPSPRHDQHPRRHVPTAWPLENDLETFAAACWLRVERQTFFPVGDDTGQAVFTIRVRLQALMQAVDSAARAQRLHDSLASMSEAVLAYKGLAAAGPRLLAWLAARRQALEAGPIPSQ